MIGDNHHGHIRNQEDRCIDQQEGYSHFRKGRQKEEVACGILAMFQLEQKERLPDGLDLAGALFVQVD